MQSGPEDFLPWCGGWGGAFCEWVGQGGEGHRDQDALVRGYFAVGKGWEVLNTNFQESFLS